MQVYKFNTINNPTFRWFVASSWEAGGIQCNDEGQPVADAQGNTINFSAVLRIKPNHADLLLSAYAGDERVSDWSAFEAWLHREAGLMPDDCRTVLVACGMPH